jgi:hypothetical protein
MEGAELPGWPPKTSLGFTEKLRRLVTPVAFIATLAMLEYVELRHLFLNTRETRPATPASYRGVFFLAAQRSHLLDWRNRPPLATFPRKCASLLVAERLGKDGRGSPSHRHAHA